MLWHEHSWPEIAALDKGTPVLVPLGSCEQHGRHLPVFVDTLQVSEIAQRVERILSDRILLMPTLWLGSSHHHKDFPGTVSLKPSLYSEVLKGVADSVMRPGFRRIFFLNGHGGNETPGAQALAEMVAERDDADDIYLAFASWWRVAREGLEPGKHGLTTPAVTHACEYETSLMLVVRPDLVRLDRVRERAPVLDGPWYRSEGEGKVGVYRRFHRLTADGSMGSPAAATAEKGHSMLGAVVDEIVAFIEAFAAWPELPAVGPA